MKTKPLDNLVFVDVETTGLDPKLHSMISLGAVVIDQDFQEVATYEKTCRQRVGSARDSRALEVNGYNPLEWDADKVNPAELIGDFLQWLGMPPSRRRWVIVGRNPTFDLNFMRAEQEAWPVSWAAKLELIVSHRTWDIHSLLYYLAFQRGVPIEGGTEALYELIGCPKEPLPHTALQGARHSLENFVQVLAALETLSPRAE